MVSQVRFPSKRTQREMGSSLQGGEGAGVGRGKSGYHGQSLQSRTLPRVLRLQPQGCQGWCERAGLLHPYTNRCLMLSALKSGHDFECAKVTPGESWLAEVCCLCTGLSEAPGGREKKSFGSIGESGWHITASTTDGLLFSSVAPSFWPVIGLSQQVSVPRWMDDEAVPSPWTTAALLWAGKVLVPVRCLEDNSLTPSILSAIRTWKKRLRSFLQLSLDPAHGNRGKAGVQRRIPWKCTDFFLPRTCCFTMLAALVSEEKVLCQFPWPRLPWCPFTQSPAAVGLGKVKQIRVDRLPSPHSPLLPTFLTLSMRIM